MDYVHQSTHYVQLNKIVKGLKKQIGQFKSQGNQVKVNEIKNEIEKIEKEKFNYTQNVINKYPNTYFSKAKVASKSKNKEDKKKLLKKVQFAAYGTLGLLAILAAAPSLFFSFQPSGHSQLIDQLSQITGGDRSFAESIAQGLVTDRISLARSDVFRSLIFVAIGAALVWALIKQKLSSGTATALLAVIILVDMWNVDKRYLNNDNFVEQTALTQQFQPREVDQFILKDTSPNFRVFDLSIQTFSNASTSYFQDRKSTRLNSSHITRSRMPSSA